MKIATLLAIGGAIAVLSANGAGARPVSGPLPPVHAGPPPGHVVILHGGPIPAEPPGTVVVILPPPPGYAQPLAQH